MIITHFDGRKHESCIKEAKRGRQECSHCNGKYPRLASQGYAGSLWQRPELQAPRAIERCFRP